MPAYLTDYLSITDPVIAFDQFMEGIEISKYLKNMPEHVTGRIRYNPVDILKTVLFAFTDKGYCSLREPEENCNADENSIYIREHENIGEACRRKKVAKSLGECITRCYRSEV